MQGAMQDFMPRAKPCVMVSAAPSFEAWASSCVGL